MATSFLDTHDVHAHCAFLHCEFADILYVAKWLVEAIYHHWGHADSDQRAQNSVIAQLRSVHKAPASPTQKVLLALARADLLPNIPDYMLYYMKHDDHLQGWTDQMRERVFTVYLEHVQRLVIDAALDSLHTW